MKALLIAVVLATVTPAAFALPGSGNACGIPSTILTIDLPDGSRYYVEQRGNPEDTSVWTYLESNGIGGLQRGGVGVLGASFPPPPAPAVLIDAETCTNPGVPDTLIF
jgi:hypothetical protein